MGFEFVNEVKSSPADVGCLAVPPCRQVGDTVAGLVSAGVDGGFALERAEFPLVRVASLPVGEVGDLVGECVVDLVGALRERCEEVVGHRGHLGLAVLDCSPGDAEAMREFVAEDRLIEAAEHSLVLLEVTGVEGEPTAIVGLNLRRDDTVSVDLRVVGP